METLAPEYNAKSPRSFNRVEITFRIPFLGGNDWPWTPALTESSGKLNAQDEAPAQPPAIGTAIWRFPKDDFDSSSRNPSYTKK